MKIALFFILTASLCPLLSNGGPYKLITGSLAKKTMGSNLRSWARSHAGIIASKSLVSLLGTAGLLGSIELVSIARNSASDPDDQQALDALLVSLTKMKESRAKRNALNLDGIYVASGGVVLFVTAVSIMYTVKRCFKKRSDLSDTTSQTSPQGVVSESQSKVISLCDQSESKVIIVPTEVEGDEIVNIDSKM